MITLSYCGVGYSRIVILAVLGKGCNEVAGGTVVHGCCGERDDQFLGQIGGSKGSMGWGVDRQPFFSCRIPYMSGKGAVSI